MTFWPCRGEEHVPQLYTMLLLQYLLFSFPSFKTRVYKYCFRTEEESHSGGTAFEVYTTVALLPILVSQR